MVNVLQTKTSALPEPNVPETLMLNAMMAVAARTLKTAMTSFPALPMPLTNALMVPAEPALQNAQL